MITIIGFVVVVYAVVRLITQPAMVPPKPDGTTRWGPTGWVFLFSLIGVVAIGWLGSELFRLGTVETDRQDPMGLRYTQPPPEKSWQSPATRP